MRSLLRVRLIVGSIRTEYADWAIGIEYSGMLAAMKPYPGILVSVSERSQKSRCP
ncbi:hypothetical protein LMG29542_00097 [Paraburkholderia humisilvae]|uniref:Uncharacterized protein n=1 Tax=Paraburkholderia humisilvae TaxID=627669 RepID=A0A6J5CVJ0_9BURK|nr:hypothetical protein LMG29542_00097 [Paraburkholderia humisilvae]